MSRIATQFRQLRREGKKALIPFITAGDPNLQTTERLIYCLEKAGANIIELGVPFSDPMADGPVIQASSERALKHKVSLTQILKLVAKVRRKSNIPILLMGYYNPIYVMGMSVFAKKAALAGVDAVLVVDLPPEEGRPLRQHLRKQGIDLVFLIAPTTNLKRIQKIVRVASGFIYYVSLTGVTGGRLNDLREVKEQIKLIRQSTNVPVAVGFGISTPKQAKILSRDADGIVVGSALVKLIHDYSKKDLQAKVSQYISSLRRAIDQEAGHHY